MRWLVVSSAEVPAEKVEEIVAGVGGKVTNPTGVPLDDDEVSFEAEGGDDLPARLGHSDVIHGVYPNSEATYL